MNGENTIFGPQEAPSNYDSNYETVESVPEWTNKPMNSAQSSSPLSTAVILYGVPDAVVAYMVPFPPQETKPWPAEYVPYVHPWNMPQAFPRPDVFGETMRGLELLGMKGTDALRLIAICDWEPNRALEIAKACKKEGNWDILKFARELMGK